MNNKPKNYNLSFFGVKIGIEYIWSVVTQYGQGQFGYKIVDDFSWKFIMRLLAQDMMCIKFMEFSNWNERPIQAFYVSHAVQVRCIQCNPTENEYMMA